MQMEVKIMAVAGLDLNGIVYGRQLLDVKNADGNWS